MLINLYHKLSTQVSLDVLRLSSDSKVGNNQCLNYRGQRINQNFKIWLFSFTNKTKHKFRLKRQKPFFRSWQVSGLARMIKIFTQIQLL